MTQEEDDFGVDDTGVSCRDHAIDQLPTAIASLSLNKSTFHHHHQHTKSANSSIQRRRIPQADIPKLTGLDQLSLHPPSSQIVGTPFATDSTKFEYPFPEDASSYSVSSASSTHATPILTPPLSSGSMYPLISASSAGLTLPCLIQPGDSSSSSSSTTSSTSSFTPVHPKFRLPSNPPIPPPSLVKKRPKWSLSIMGRRRNSYENHPGDGFSDQDGSMDLIESFLRGDYGDAVIVPHSQRDELSRSEH